MNPLIRQNIQDNIIKFDIVKNHFECLLCDVKLSGEATVQDHLNSKQHRDEGGRNAIRTLRTAPSSLLNLVPELILAAAKAGYLSVVGNEIYCLICNSPNQGMITLSKHLECRSHIKKLEDKVASQEKRDLPQTPSLTFSSPGIQCAVSEKIVQVLPGSIFQCIICNNLHVTGEIKLEEHLVSKKHREAGAKYAVTNFKTAPKSLLDNLPPYVKEAAASGIVIGVSFGDLQCTICSVSLNGVISMNQHLLGDDHKTNFSRQTYSAVGNATATALPSPPVVEDMNTMGNPLLKENKEINEAQKQGIVIETDNRLEPFQCRACEKKFNNSGPLLDHLKSTKHKLKVKTLLESRALSPPVLDTNSPEPTAEATGARRKQYSVISDTRGHVYVFNYSFKNTPKVRKGAEHDSQNLKQLFQKMGYAVFLHNDLTGDETSKKLNEIQRKPELNEIDAFIMCFLSHGSNNYTFYANDMVTINLHSIRRKFTDRKCPYLRGKPKIFLANYCRGDQMEKKTLEEDDIEPPRDMVTIHAASEGIQAKRDPSVGTIFIASLCEVMKKHAKEYELRDIYHELEEIMRIKGGTTPMWEDYIFKPFYFNPSC